MTEFFLQGGVVRSEEKELEGALLNEPRLAFVVDAKIGKPVRFSSTGGASAPLAEAEAYVKAHHSGGRMLMIVPSSNLRWFIASYHWKPEDFLE